MIRFVIRALAVVVIPIAASACGTNQWQTKATPNERVASERVGGFSSEEASLYHSGTQHIVNLHQSIGAYTIGQVVDQERQREKNRADTRATDDQRRRDAASTKGLHAAMALANTIGPHLYRGGSISNGDCALTIDADGYESASNQDQSLIKQSIVTMCVSAYKELGKDSRPLPASGLGIHTYDLAGSAIYTDNATEDTANLPTARPKRTVAHADPRGAYTILEHWDVPCSGHGGFGEKVMALSHKQSDLEAVYHRWMKEHDLDKSQCIDFFAFSNNASYDAFQHPTNYTDTQLAAIPDGLSYTNNPNTGYQQWVSPDGTAHDVK